MTDEVRITWGNGFTDIFLIQINGLPESNWRKICRVMRQFPDKNKNALGHVLLWFEESLQAAEQDVYVSERVYQNGYVDPSTAPRGEKTAAKARNAELKRDLDRSRAWQEKLKKRYSIFKEEVLDG